MATKLKPSEVKKKVKSRLEALARLRARILNDVESALVDLTTSACVTDVGSYGADPLEAIEDAIDEVRDCLDRLEEQSEKMQEVMIEQDDVEEQLAALEEAKGTPKTAAPDGATLDRIALALKGEWDADVFSEVAAMVRATGRKV